jgi:hypothetical protein
MLAVPAPVQVRSALYGILRKTDTLRRYDYCTPINSGHPIDVSTTIEVAAAADKALKEYKTLHPDVQDEDIRVELPPPPPPNMPIQDPPGRGRWLPPPPAYVQVHHAHNAHVPVAHPVMALPLPQLGPPFNFDHLFAPGPPDFGGVPPHPLQGPEAQEMFPMPVQLNPLLPPPPAMLPLQLPPLPPLQPPLLQLQPPPLQQELLPKQELPPIQVVVPPVQAGVHAPGRVGRVRRKR